MRFVAAESHNDALDLPPVAEARNIAGIAAALRPDRSFKAGVVTEAVDQIRGIGKGGTPVNEGTLHA